MKKRMQKLTYYEVIRNLLKCRIRTGGHCWT